MKKKRRIRVWVVASVTIVVTFGIFFYLATREHPDYVRAAEGLPEAREKAIEMFGQLTWEEYRAERGIATRDDTAAWEMIGKSLPSTNDYHDTYTPRGRVLETAFLRDRAWFMNIGDDMENLTLQHVYDPKYEQWSSRATLAVLSIDWLWWGGVIGAADVGDHEAVREIAKSHWSYFEKEMCEPDWMSYMSHWLQIALFQDSLLSAAVRNRQDAAVLEAIQNAVASSPQRMLLADAFAGDVRSESLMLDELRVLNVEEVDQWLDDYLVDIQEVEAMFPAVGSTQRDLVEQELYDVYERYRVIFRGIGSHTTDAIETRIWQTTVDYHKILVGAESDPSGTIKRIDEFEEELMSLRDASYEIAQLMMHFNVLVSKLMLEQADQRVFKRNTREAAIAMVMRYREHSSLPDRLPSDLVFDDPLGDGDAIYRKTGSGFVIYSRGENGIDDGFVPSSPDDLRQSDVSELTFGDDWGTAVCYDPIVP